MTTKRYVPLMVFDRTGPLKRTSPQVPLRGGIMPWRLGPDTILGSADQLNDGAGQVSIYT